MGNAQASAVDDPDGGKADPTRVTTSRRWWILLLVQVSTLSFGIAITATNVVVPQIRGALSLTHDEGAWIVTLFLAAAAVATPLTVHFHCCVIDRVFALGEDGQVHFAEAGALTPEDLGAVQQQVRARVLRWFARAGTLDPADARDMAGWDHGGGFSLDASVRIDSAERAGLERLLRYCARPPFALERLEQVAEDRLRYRFPKPQPDGRTELRLTPLELIDRLAALIAPPRLHRHR